MLRFVVRRLLLLIPILFGVSVLLFFWVRALPGGPAESLLGERATPALVEAYKERYGLNEPVWRQYVTYIQTTIQDRDLGISVATHREVTDEIRQRFPATVELALAAMFFAVSFGIPLGLHRGEAVRRAARPREPVRLPDRDLDPHLLARDPAQVHLRGPARAGSRASGASMS